MPLPAAQPLDTGGLVLLFFGLVCMEDTAHAERAAPRFISLRNMSGAVDNLSAGRKIGPLEQLHQAAVLDMRIVDQFQRRIDNFRSIVRGDRGRHTHRNPACPIGEQIGKQARHKFRLFLLAIVGRDEINRALVQTLHQLDRGLGQPRLGIAIGGSVIPVDIAEISLPLDQRITQRKILSQPYHRIVSGRVAMRVIFADHLAHDAG